MTQVEKAQAAARAAENTAWAAVKRWTETRTAEDEAAMERATAAYERAMDAVDRAEVRQDARETEQSNWWDAAWANACAA